MTSRREFLEVAALSTLPAAISGRPVVAAAALRNGAASAAAAVDIVVFDARYSEARSVASRIIRAGATMLHALADGDITSVWLNEIGPAWQRGPAVVAGLTARPALFCLEQFALTSGLRVVFHAEHVVHPDGRTHHSLLRGAENLGLSSPDLKQAGSRWHARVADALVTYRPQPGAKRFGRSDAALEPDIPPRSQLLTSWIIAAA